MFEAILFSIAPDERWDARHNAGVAQRSHGGWSNVFVAIAAVVGAIFDRRDHHAPVALSKPILRNRMSENSDRGTQA